ncbi:MAG: hypothetical protein AB7U73_01470, partial [Pirellulales bacterium]
NRSENRDLKTALDAVIGSYLMLKGEAGLPLVEDRFLTKKDADYTDTYAAITAIRIIGQEDIGIPRQRLIEALRHMLDRPQYADLVIADLARWEDWDSMDRLVQLFKDATDDTNWVRVPVIHFLKACPLPEAKAQIDELAKIDPDAVKRANSFFPLAAPKVPPPDDTVTDNNATQDGEAATAPASDTTDSGASTTSDAEAAAEDDLPPPPVADPEDTPVSARRAPAAPERPTTTADVAAAMAAGATEDLSPSNSQTDSESKSGDRTDEDTAVAATMPTDEFDSEEEEESAALAPRPLPVIATWKVIAIPLAAGAILLAVYMTLLGRRRGPAGS